MSARRLTLTALVSLCALAGFLVLSGASASAFFTHPYLCQITAGSIPSATECNGTGNAVPGGSFGAPQGVAVDGAGHVYVSDGTKKVVDVFDSSGTFTGQLTGASPGSPFSNPWGLAVDGSNDVWVADVGPGLMDKFDSSGKSIAQGAGEGHWSGVYTESVAFSNASGHLYVADSNKDDLWVLNSDGSFNTDIPGSEATWGAGCCFIKVAADNSGGAANGDIYVSSSNTVTRIDGAGTPVGFSGSASYISGAQLTGTPAGSFGGLAGVTVDSSGHVYVLDNSHSVIDEFDSTGLFLGQTSGAGTPNGSFGDLTGVAVAASGNVYVAERGFSGVVNVFGPGVVLPTVTTGAASSVTETSATLEGVVNPDGTSVTGCQFEYRTQEEASYTHSVPCSQSLPLTGTAPVAVSANATGLTGNEIYNYRLAATNANGTTSGQDATLQTPGAPRIDAESFSSVGSTHATLCARINPGGFATHYRFEYGATTAYGTSSPIPDGEIPSGFSGEEVCIKATGLEPNTAYHFRVVATNEGGAPVDGADETLTTLPPVLIDSTFVTNVASSSVDLRAQINVLGNAAAYHFEYGTTTSYGTSIPVPDVEFGSGEGEGDQTVSQHLQELTPNTLYHYRVVVHNTFGTVTGPDGTFTTQPPGTKFVLPDGRQWELVSPPNKHGARIQPIETLGQMQAAEDGSGIVYQADVPTESQPQGYTNYAQILSRRGAQGWSSLDISPRHDRATQLTGDEYEYFSPDLSLGLSGPTSQDLTLLSDRTSEVTLYIRHESLCDAPATASECFMPVLTSKEGFSDVPPGGHVAGVSGGNETLPARFEASTPDLNHVVFKWAANTPGAGVGLYEWSAGVSGTKAVQLVSELPASEGGLESTGLLGVPAPGFEQNVRRAVSNDGSRMFWQNNETFPHLYMRDTVKQETVRLDVPQAGVASGGPPQPMFQIASSDGSKVFFSDPQRLTAQSGASWANESQPEVDLYECDIVEEAGKLKCRLTDLTPENGGQAADVRNLVLGASEDGSYIYFVANGVLGNGAEHGATRGNCSKDSEPRGKMCNLYEYHDGVTTFIGTLSSNEEDDWASDNVPSFHETGFQTARVSPDGRYVTFMSNRPLTGYDNRDANSGMPDSEVYMYDAVSKHLSCVSCNPTGARPVGVEVKNFQGAAGTPAHKQNLVDVTFSTYGGRPGTSWIAANLPAGTVRGPYGESLYQPRYLADSGRLFFNSSDALVPQDVNGQEDVYEYEPPGVGGCSTRSVTFSARSGGCVSLITSGTSPEESGFMDASEGGGDVFFLTASRLTSQDYDRSIDVYDAHECSVSVPCVAQPVGPPACSSGDSCKAAPALQPPVFGAPSSATFSGAGNVSGSPSARVVAGKSLSRAQKLARAIRVCHRKPRRKRGVCERQARKQFAVSAARGVGRRGKVQG
jgi:hypothetical protein